MAAKPFDRSMSRSLAKARSLQGEHESRAETAYNAIVDSLRATQPNERVAPTIDLQDAGKAVLNVLTRQVDDALRARLAKLDSVGEFRLALLTELEVMAWAAVHIRRRLLLNLGAESESRVPAFLVDQAATLRARMLRVVEYHLDDHADYSALIAHIREGAGHLDLANDLDALADLYRDAGEILKTDVRRYNRDDATLARDLSQQIYRALGGTDVASEDWTAMQSAVWPKLHRGYEELRRAGRFLLHFEDGDARFPALVSAARAEAAHAHAAQSEAPAAG